MEATSRQIKPRNLDAIMEAHAMSASALPPSSPGDLIRLITTVGPLEESLAGTAVHLGRVLGVPASVKVRLNGKTYEYGRFPSDTLYEIPLVGNTQDGVSVLFSQDPNGFPPGRVAALALALPYLQIFAKNGIDHLRATMRPAYDPLTRLPNRESFSHEFQYALREAEDAALAGTHRGLGLVLLDIDHFKQYNDTKGHQEGDKCLIRMADYLRGGTRESDVYARWGGEEFVVAVLNATKDETVGAAERLRSYVERHSTSDFAAGTLALPFTVTVGVAHTSETPPGTTPATLESTLLGMADERLYRAKHNQDGLTRNSVSSKYRRDKINTSQ